MAKLYWPIHRRGLAFRKYAQGPENRNPYDNALLTELSLGDVSDLDDAYQAAATAQKAWAQTLPNERSALLMRAVSVLEARHEEIVD